MSRYITENRIIIEAIESLSREQAIEYKSYSDGWILKLKKHNQVHFVYVYGFDINSQSSAGIASDKVATFEILYDSNISAIPHHLLSTVVDRAIPDNILYGHLSKYREIVIKPTRGKRGENIAKVNSREQSIQHTSDKSVNSWAISPFVEIEREIRLIVLNGKTVLAYEKIDPVTINNLKMFNLNLGAKSKALNIAEVDDELKKLASKAMVAIGLKLGAVDIIFEKNGSYTILEINSGFSLEHYAMSSSQNKEKVIEVYSLIINELFDLHRE